MTKNQPETESRPYKIPGHHHGSFYAGAGVEQHSLRKNYRLEGFFGGIPLAFDAGTVFFPIAYIFGDILTEVYGFARARRVIWRC